jgi:uncharacterized protein
VASGVNVNVMVAGKEIPDDHFTAFSIDRDIFQPDTGSIVLANQANFYSGQTVTGDVEVLVGSTPKSIYKGQITGLEPTYSGKDKTTILLRSHNAMHQLMRKRVSKTYQNMTDQAILNQVVQNSGLTLDWKHSKTITYPHVYQHNMTDLEFLRMRAGRLGCHFWCIDKKITCQEPDLQTTTQLELTIDPSSKGVVMTSFRPRLQSTQIVSKVTVKGWNPETKELITGTASVKKSPLGDSGAADKSGTFGGEETVIADQPIWAKDEADAIAAGKLSDLSLSYMTGEAEVQGSGDFELGTVITVTVLAKPGKDPFNGKYYVMGISHRFKSANKAYTTILRLARDAQDS